MLRKPFVSASWLVIPLLSVILSLISCAERSRVSAVRWVVENPGIVGGAVVTADEAIAKSTVALIMSKNNKVLGICTGSLIHPQLVLTAAHCFDERPERVVAAFSMELEGLSLERTRNVVQRAVHGDWGKNLKNGPADIAVVKLDSPAPEGTVPVTFLPASVELNGGDEIVIAGYGYVDGHRQVGRGVLRQAKTKILGQRSETEIVSGDTPTGLCFGDSGGPAFVERDGGLYQWGIAVGVNSANCDDLSAYTDIFSYLDWLQSSQDLLLK